MENNAIAAAAALKWLRLNCSRPVSRWPGHIGAEMFDLGWGKLLVVHGGHVAMMLPVSSASDADRRWLKAQGFQNAGSCDGVIIYRHAPGAKVPAWLAAEQAKFLSACNVNWEGSTRHGGHWE